jgi:hypothetical protein
MSINYYLQKKPNLMERLAGVEDNFLHIGKSSGGWCFSLHVGDGSDNLPRSLKEWYKLFRRNHNTIRDEYSRVLTPDEMLAVICKRSCGPFKFRPYEWYKTEEEFFEKNSALKGPNNLLRHKIGGTCIGHGAGTWDLRTGEFF